MRTSFNPPSGGSKYFDATHGAELRRGKNKKLSKRSKREDEVEEDQDVERVSLREPSDVAI